jgi:hypothetical protein
MTSIPIIAAVVLLSMTGYAHAQSSTMVQCRTGATAIVVPDYVCDALLDGFRHLSTEQNKSKASMMECSKAMARHFVPGNNQYWYLEPCQRMLAGEFENRR